MATPATTFQSYQAKGNREELSDLIDNISPAETPFLSGLAKEGCDNTFFEWQTDALRAAAANAQVEGDDVATFAAVNPTARIGNYTQISRIAFVISNTQQAIKSAGRPNEINYQKLKQGKELKKDIEFALLTNTTFNTGSATVGRQTRGVRGWVATNVQFGTGGAAPIPSSNTAPVAGTNTALTEAKLKTAMQAAYTAGGSPDTLFVRPSDKVLTSAFNGGTTRFEQADSGKIHASYKVYESEFGPIKVVPIRTATISNFAFLADMSHWKVRTLSGRWMQDLDLGQTGDGKKYAMVAEYGLQASNEAASALIADLS